MRGIKKLGGRERDGEQARGIEEEKRHTETRTKRWRQIKQGWTAG